MRMILSVIICLFVPLFEFIAYAEDVEETKTGKPVVEMNAALDEKEAAFKKIDLLIEELMNIKGAYVDEKKMDDIMNGAIHGMLQSLDPYSDYLEPKAIKDLKDDAAGSYGGLGIYLGIKNGVLTVISPIEDTPAYKAGILAGDKILEIDGIKTMNLKMGEATQKLRGEKGAKVRLKILRGAEQEPREIEMVRAIIEISSVKGVKMLKDGIGYVRITQFAMPTGKLLEEALKKLNSEGMKGMILDLRNNPGGLVASSIEVAQKFLNKDDVIVTTKGRKSYYGEHVTKAEGTNHYVNFPMVILVNGGTASASEIVAGALKDNKRAVLIGDVTYGKGVIQSVINSRVDPQAGYKITSARYYTPSGRMIHDNGVEPDIPVYVGPEEWYKVQLRRAQLETPAMFSDEEKKQYENVEDKQLQRAVDVLGAMLLLNTKKNFYESARN